MLLSNSVVAVGHRPMACQGVKHGEGVAGQKRRKRSVMPARVVPGPDLNLLQVLHLLLVARCLLSTVYTRLARHV